ncbi:ATP-binding cassette domain-containing protein [Pseudoroseicyclus sp. CXY001]|uniref:ATP-binding cassette domain-containing protein n=1 Tax=Pseudoroseicyclus sp. CXY001 TaxID=3242492 RepID=UPI00358DACC3
MTPLLRTLRLLLGAAPWAMARGAALAVLVLVMGAALLGLSGWFITATGLAGLAGIGIAFDVFRPSAGVRFLALGRTAARYGERLLTHDATLRALAALRVTLLRRHAGLGARALARLRGEAALTRMVADVDALDGLVLRLALPGMAAVVTHLAAFAGLAWIVGLPVAAMVAGLYLPGAALVLWRLARRSLVPSAAAEDGAQALRRAIIDMIRDREALILSGALGAREEALIALDASARAEAAAVERAERGAGALLALLSALAAAGALGAGGWLLAEGRVDPAVAAIGLFVALALAETLAPLARGLAELGRTGAAAARVEAAPEPPAAPRPPLPPAPILEVPRLGLTLAPGTAVALTGPSGAGKSTLLLAIAGLLPAEGITLAGKPPEAWSDASLRARVTLLPQRSALIAGSIRENLTLAAGDPDAALEAVLAAVWLTRPLRPRGGLEARLGEGGAGLSGGQARRLALARALLARPDILLLDEPTEGLDAETAAAVLQAVRDALPQAALLVALHKGAGHPIFDATLRLDAGS